MGRHWVRQRKKTCNTVLIIMMRKRFPGASSWLSRAMHRSCGARGFGAGPCYLPLRIVVYCSRTLSALGAHEGWRRPGSSYVLTLVSTTQEEGDAGGAGVRQLEGLNRWVVMGFVRERRPVIRC